MLFGNQLSISGTAVGVKRDRSASARFPNNLDYGLDSRKFKAYRFMNKLNSHRNVIYGLQTIKNSKKF